MTAAAFGAAAGAAQALIEFGADKVLKVEHDSLAGADADAFVDAAAAACKHVGDAAVLIPGDRLGWEVAPRLAHRLEAGLVTDAVDLAVEDGRIVATKPVYGGKAHAKIAVRSATQAVLVRQRTQAPLERDGGRSGDVENFAFSPGPHVGRVRVVEHKQDDAGDEIRLEDAKVVVAGGRGLGGPEPFASWPSSRSCWAARWGRPWPRWTRAGRRRRCRSARRASPWRRISTSRWASRAPASTWPASAARRPSSAINKDAEAPIFRVAHLGVVADYKEVLPAFTDELRRIKG